MRSERDSGGLGGRVRGGARSATYARRDAGTSRQKRACARSGPGRDGGSLLSIELIVGPPNSGRTGEILGRFVAALAGATAEPVLVVPTSDDVDRFERELCARSGGLLGGKVTSFPGLFEEVAHACGAASPPPLSTIQRVWLARAAGREAELRLLRRSAERQGFAPALETLLTDLQSAGLDAASFSALAGELEDGGAYEAEIARLLSAYERLRDELGRGDEHGSAAAAITALRTDPRAWEERPVLLYGFDDLSRQQIELLAALGEASPVTVALAYEDRPALAARAELLGTLRDELGAQIVAKLSPDSTHTASATLFHLERTLFEEAPPTAACDDSLSILEAAGERGEAELLGRRIARLISAGADPDEIAIAVRNPDRQAPLLARVLASLGVPAAAEARIPLSATATGSTVLRLLSIAGGSGSAEDVIAFLRGPARANPASVDWLERRVLRERMNDAAQAVEAWRTHHGREIWALDALAEAGDDRARAAGVIASIAADIAERPHLRSGPLPSSGPAVELRAAAELSRAVAEAAQLGRHAPTPAELVELLGHVRVRLWRGPTEGRVRILSPYRLRASRVHDLFVAGLTDGSFPSPGGVEPLLSETRRRELGISSRRDATAEERYLFYACVSRPERSLALSYPAADESGAAIARSPFVDEVRALLDPAPPPNPADDELEAEIAERIGIGEIAVEPEQASSPRDLARALAALPEQRAEQRAAALDIPDEVRAQALASVALARAGIAAARAPGPLSAAPVLAELGAQDLYGASTLEEYDVCPYRWFVGHELDPQRIEPDPEPLETGGIVHDGLELLFRDPPATGGAAAARRPAEDTLPAWVEAAHARLREAAAKRGWDLESARARISLARLDAVLERFLRRDAADQGPMQPDPELLEAAFGSADEDSHPAADLGSFRLRGRVDRIDVSSDGKALIRDYKLSSKVSTGKKLIEDGKLQLPLYMKAVQGMGLEPIGGLYHPLGATRNDRPRGIMVAEHRGALISDATEAHVRTDFLGDDDFEALVEEAAERAREIVAGIQGGEVLRAPRGGSCPRWCTYAPICRMERGVADPEAEEEDEEGRR